MSEQDFFIFPALGFVELKQFDRVEDGEIVCYSYSITRDRDGTELSRTDPEAISRMYWATN